MLSIIKRSIKKPLRSESLDFDERWNRPDDGLILCWENGRRMSEQQPELAGKARRGELPILVWKGGVQKNLKGKKQQKLGTWHYLATWQGLRGDDLEIPVDEQITITCSKTRQEVLFSSKLPLDNEDADED